MVRSALFMLCVTGLVAQAAESPRSVLDLKLFFQQNCVKCHGLDGSARGPEGKRLKGRDFTSEKEMKGTTEAGLAKTIRNGIFFGKVMPAFKKELTEEEARLLVREIILKAVKGQPIAPQVDPRPLVPRSIRPEKN